MMNHKRRTCRSGKRKLSEVSGSTREVSQGGKELETIPENFIQVQRVFECPQCGRRYTHYTNLQQHKRQIHGIRAIRKELLSKQCSEDAKTNIKGQDSSNNSVLEKKDWATICKERKEMLKSKELEISESLPEAVLAHRKTERARLQLQNLAEKYEVTRFPCENCNETFDSYKTWKNHNLTAHKPGFKCDTCGRILASALNLENHIRSIHHPASILTCSECNKTIIKSDTFNEHLKRHPACLKKSIPCKECKKRFSSKESLDLHTLVRHIQKLPTPFKCSFCDRSFNSKVLLSLHEATHSQTRDFICDRCGMGFYHHKRLAAHIIRGHINQEPGGRRYPCKMCPSDFPTPGGLARHTKLHRPDSPYVCTLCGKRFKLQNYLTIHMWSHDPKRHEKYSLYKNKSKYPRNRSEAQRKRTRKRVTAVAKESDLSESCNDASSMEQFPENTLPDNNILTAQTSDENSLNLNSTTSNLNDVAGSSSPVLDPVLQVPAVPDLQHNHNQSAHFSYLGFS